MYMCIYMPILYESKTWKKVTHKDLKKKDLIEKTNYLLK